MSFREGELYSYSGEFIKCLLAIEATDIKGEIIFLPDGIKKGIELINSAKENDSSLIFIGNGGSAATSSHQALDFALKCKIDTRAFNDPCFLTCMGNDFGYENVFQKQILPIAKVGDILVAISGSGESQNILKGVEAAQKHDCYIITMSGFGKNNSLRKKGNINFYVPSASYRIVEAAHSLYWDFILEMLISRKKA